MSSRRLCECILFLSVFFLSFRHFDDADGWWHLKTGQQILQTGSIPYVDPYSETRAGQPWIPHEWLAQVLMFSLYSAGGFTLVTVVFALLSTTAFWIVYRRCPQRPFLPAIPLIMGVAAASPMLGARPQVLSVLFASIFIWVLERYAKRRHQGYLWALVGLMLLWVNVHGAFILGPILIALQILGLAVDRIQNKNSDPRAQLKHLGVALLACTAATAVNPSGLRLIGYVMETVRRTTEQVYLADWASPNFHDFRFQLFAALILGLFVALALSRERISAGQILSFSAVTWLGLQSVRHIPIFVLIAVPLIVTQIYLCIRDLTPTNASTNTSREFPRINVAILAVAILLMANRVVSLAASQKTAEETNFPRAAVEFIRDNRVSGPMFNLYEWGGYLIWNLYPDWKVFVDGRPEIYGDAYIQDYVDAYYGRRDWQHLLKRFEIRTVIVEPTAPLASLLRESTEWKNAFEDKVAVVFVRSSPGSPLNGVR